MTKDKKYIVKVECYSKLADELRVIFANRIKNIIKENENILAVNYPVGNERLHFGLVNDTMNNKLYDSLISQGFIDKAQLPVQYLKDSGTIIAGNRFSDSVSKQNLHSYLLKYQHRYLLKYQHRYLPKNLHCYLPFTMRYRNNLNIFFK